MCTSCAGSVRLWALRSYVVDLTQPLSGGVPLYTSCAGLVRLWGLRSYVVDFTQPPVAVYPCTRLAPVRFGWALRSYVVDLTLLSVAVYPVHVLRWFGLVVGST